ncbi:MAG: histidine kinase dimerization/phospho-acceptor domain-containing protein, partial [Myxococcota bacterium]
MSGAMVATTVLGYVGAQSNYLSIIRGRSESFLEELRAGMKPPDRSRGKLPREKYQSQLDRLFETMQPRGMRFISLWVQGHRVESGAPIREEITRRRLSATESSPHDLYAIDGRIRVESRIPMGDRVPPRPPRYRGGPGGPAHRRGPDGHRGPGSPDKFASDGPKRRGPPPHRRGPGGPDGPDWRGESAGGPDGPHWRDESADDGDGPRRHERPPHRRGPRDSRGRRGGPDGPPGPPPGLGGRDKMPDGLAGTILEFEPLVAQATIDRAQRTLIISILIALTLLIAAGLAFRWLRRREQLEDKLAHERQLAKLGEMSAVLAHELRNPLASLKGHAQLLSESLPEGRAQAKADRVVNEALRLENLTSDLLAFVRTGSISRRPVDPVSVVRSAVEELDAERVEIYDDLAPAEWSLDPDRMHQVLSNLLHNAVQASPEEQSIIARVG